MSSRRTLWIAATLTLPIVAGCDATLGSDQAFESPGRSMGSQGLGGQGAVITEDEASYQSPYACGPEQMAQQGRSFGPLRRLSREELQVTLRKVLGDALFDRPEISERVSGLPHDVQFSANDFSKDPPPNLPIVLSQIGIQVAKYGLTDPDWRKDHLPACVDDDLDASCVETFIRDFGQRIWRRPLEQERVQTYLAFFEETGGGEEGLSLLIRRLLQAPPLVFHLEPGTPSEDEGPIALSPFEVASRISYFATGGPPDDELWEAAEDGELDTLEAVQTQTERLLRSELGRQKVDDFFRYYTHTDTVVDPRSDVADWAGIEDVRGLGAEMQKELQDFVESVVYDEEGTFFDLMTAERAYPRSEAMASIFGADEAPGSGALPAPDHPGLLHRPALLQSTGARTNVIVRGAHIRELYLCDQLDTPDPDVLFLGLEELRDTSALPNREAVAAVTEVGPCRACHSMINPLGFAFEGYDQMGRTRTEEVIFDEDGDVVDTFPIDTSVANAFIEPGGPENIKDSRELVEALGNSAKAQVCFQRRVFEYYRRRTPTQENDGCILSSDDHSRDPLISKIAKTIANESIFWRENPDED